MKRLLHPVLLAILALAVGIPRAHAATTLDVNITFTIAAVVSVEWAGGYSGTGTVTWPLGTVALGSTYETVTPTPLASWTNNLRIRNTSTSTNTAVDIDLVLQAGPAAGWTAAADGTAAANVFSIRALAAATNTTGALAAGSIITTSATTDFIAGLAVSTNSNEIDFQFQTPTTISSNAGVAQTITLRFTASVDN